MAALLIINFSIELNLIVLSYFTKLIKIWGNNMSICIYKTKVLRPVGNLPWPVACLHDQCIKIYLILNDFFEIYIFNLAYTWTNIGAIQIICDTCLALFRLPSPYVTF